MHEALQETSETHAARQRLPPRRRVKVLKFPPSPLPRSLRFSVVLSQMIRSRFSTWAGTSIWESSQSLEPKSVAELQSIVRECTESNRVLRVVGALHSPNDCAKSSDTCISLRFLDAVEELNVEKKLIRAQGGATLAALNERLSSVGLAFANLGSISEQTIAGAISTGTHGTGINFGIFASTVRELQLILADGTLTTCSTTENPGACVVCARESSLLCLRWGVCGKAAHEFHY